jgi:hypothetical protein
MLSQVSGHWAKDLLAKYYRSLIAKLNQHDIELRSVRLSVRSAVNFLSHTKLASGALPDQRVLEAFWRHSPGQVAAVTGFINFLNKAHNLKLDPRPSGGRNEGRSAGHCTLHPRTVSSIGHSLGPSRMGTQLPQS